MSLGADIKETYQDVGVEYTILRQSGNISGEYLDYSPNSQVTKPFVREYFLEADIPYDTQADSGNVIQFSDGRRFLIMNKTPEMFEDEIISFSCVLYKTNIVAVIMRPVEVRDEHSLEITTSWGTVTSGEHALLVDKLFGAELNQRSDIGQLAIEGDECYIPASLGVQVLDRLIVSGEYAGGIMSGEMYKVEVIKKRDFDNVWVCNLVEDTRG